MDLELEPLEPCFKEDATDSDNPGNYQGIERRQLQRRVKAERRAVVRFESGTVDRRSGMDRRSGEIPWNNYYRL